jgi:hypothetical protein
VGWTRARLGGARRREVQPRRRSRQAWGLSRIRPRARPADRPWRSRTEAPRAAILTGGARGRSAATARPGQSNRPSSRRRHDGPRRTNIPVLPHALQPGPPRGRRGRASSVPAPKASGNAFVTPALDRPRCCAIAVAASRARSRPGRWFALGRGRRLGNGLQPGQASFEVGAEEVVHRLEQTHRPGLFGHTKVSGRAVLRRGLSPLATTISTPQGAPVLAGVRLRAGRAGSSKGAASMVRDAIATAKAAGATGVLVRGDSAYGNGPVITACRRAKASFSFVLTKNPAAAAAITGIDEAAWTPVQYPGAVTDPDTGDLISDALPSKGRRNPAHRVQGDQARGHRPTDRPAGQGRQPARRTGPADPALAPPPVPHRLHRAGHRRRHHPPTARDHRDGLGRPDRRALGPPAIRDLRRERRLGDPGRDHPQPAPRRRDPDRHPLHRRPRRDPAPSDHQRPGPAGPPRAPPGPAPTHRLAARHRLEHAVAQRLHHLTTTAHRTTATTRHRHSPAPANTTRTGWNSQQHHHARHQQDHIKGSLNRRSPSIHGSRLKRCQRGSADGP